MELGWKDRLEFPAGKVLYERRPWEAALRATCSRTSGTRTGPRTGRRPPSRSAYDGRRSSTTRESESRLYVQDVAKGLPRPITPQRVTFSSRGGSFVSPDGRFVVGWNAQPSTPNAPGFTLYPLDGGSPRPVRGLRPRDVPIQWSEDGRLFVDDWNGTVFLLDPSSGKRKLWMELPPPDPTHFYGGVLIARDGKAYVRASERFSSNLFVLDGVR